MRDFDFEIKAHGVVRVIHMKGKLMEKDQAANLLNEIKGLVDQNINNFVVDLSAMGYINSTGLNVLINILTKARNAGGEVIIANVPSTIKKLLLITKLNTVFTVREDVESALLQFTETVD